MDNESRCRSRASEEVRRFWDVTTRIIGWFPQQPYGVYRKNWVQELDVAIGFIFSQPHLIRRWEKVEESMEELSRRWEDMVYDFLYYLNLGPFELILVPQYTRFIYNAMITTNRQRTKRNKGLILPNYFSKWANDTTSYWIEGRDGKQYYPQAPMEPICMMILLSEAIEGSKKQDMPIEAVTNTFLLGPNSSPSTKFPLRIKVPPTQVQEGSARSPGTPSQASTGMAERSSSP